jgi:uncharacterized damage-inducible protein DinB
MDGQYWNKVRKCSPLQEGKKFNRICLHILHLFSSWLRAFTFEAIGKARKLKLAAFDSCELRSEMCVAREAIRGKSEAKNDSLKFAPNIE